MLWPYVVLFGWSFLAATVVPLGSEVAFVALVRHDGQWAAPVAVATVGNVLGGLTTFWLGRRAATRLGAAPTARQQRALGWLRRCGAPLLVLSWVPLVGDLLVGAAGALGLAPAPVAAWLIIGKAGRYGALAWATLQLSAA